MRVCVYSGGYVPGSPCVCERSVCNRASVCGLGIRVFGEPCGFGRALGSQVSDCPPLLLGQCLSLSSYLLPPSPLPLALPLITPSSSSLPLLLFQSLCSFPPFPTLSPLPLFLSVSLMISAHLCGCSNRQSRARNPHQTAGWWSEPGAQLSRGPQGISFCSFGHPG